MMNKQKNEKVEQFYKKDSQWQACYKYLKVNF